jgi:hypothetical protein
VNCPNCGLISPPTAERCDCGYEFAASTSNESHGAEEPGAEDSADRADCVDPVQDFVDRYCASPEPQRATEVLRGFLKSPLAQDRNSVAWYFFARVAQDHASLIREYEPLLREIPEGRTALLLALWQCGDAETKAFLEACLSESEFEAARDQIDHVVQDWKPGWVRPLEHPAENTADLDLLWYEFRATGNLAAVVRIIDVLEQADTVRGKLVTPAQRS